MILVDATTERRAQFREVDEGEVLYYDDVFGIKIEACGSCDGSEKNCINDSGALGFIGLDEYVTHYPKAEMVIK